MSYFSRLRQQSELNVTAHMVHAVGQQPLAVPTTTDDLEITEVVETRLADPVRVTPHSPEFVMAPAETREPVPQSDSPSQPTAQDVGVPTIDSSPLSSAPLRPARPASHRDATVAETIETSPVSAAVALGEVFRWIATAPQSPEGDVRPVEPAHLEGASPTAHAPRPASHAVARLPVQPLVPLPPAPSVRELRATPVEGDLVEPIDAAPERQPRRTVPTPSAIDRRDAQPDVDETLTVSIGAIHVRVDAPAPPPAPAQRPASPRPTRAARSTGSRLARHYLRT